MEPEEFLNPKNTVFKWDQVITEDDLRDAIEMLSEVYNATPTHNTLERDRIEVAVGTLNTLLDWIVAGKPADFRGMV